MSTLGDLLAEHTMLPGNAVDHLHAVVGEWQLLADLSFADYLMWVCRDDGMLVCVAQCRPNTAPTVLQTDAVGTVVASERLTLVAETFASGAAKADDVAAQQDSWLPGTHVEASPVRYGGHVVAVLTRHQTAVAADRASGQLEIAYRECAADLVHMLAEGTFPDVGTWPCRAPPRAPATASSASTSTASSPTPAPTRCRPTTGWGSPPSWRATTSSRSPGR